MFFLDSTKTPGNKLTDSRMILKGYPLPHPAPMPEPQKSVRNATKFLLRNSAKILAERIPKDSVSHKGETRQEARIGRQESPGGGDTKLL